MDHICNDDDCGRDDTGIGTYKQKHNGGRIDHRQRSPENSARLGYATVIPEDTVSSKHRSMIVSCSEQAYCINRSQAKAALLGIQIGQHPYRSIRFTERKVESLRPDARMAPWLQRRDAVKVETRRTAPDDDIAVMEQNALRPAGARHATPEKGRG